jgi:hypothetical protein
MKTKYQYTFRVTAGGVVDKLKSVEADNLPQAQMRINREFTPKVFKTELVKTVMVSM